jgi:hypothetical protein
MPDRKQLFHLELKDLDGFLFPLAKPRLHFSVWLDGLRSNAAAIVLAQEKQGGIAFGIPVADDVVPLRTRLENEALEVLSRPLPIGPLAKKLLNENAAYLALKTLSNPLERERTQSICCRHSLEQYRLPAFMRSVPQERHFFDPAPTGVRERVPVFDTDLAVVVRSVIFCTIS